MSELQFKGYAVHDTNKWSEFKLIDFESKRFEDYDVEVKIDYCGVCGSDVHTITGGWGKPMLPVIPGHEIVGIVQRVGPKVSEFKKGDRVGVGAQVGACLKCTNCKNDNENYCIEGNIDTYNAKYPNGDIAHGGYSTGIRAHERFVFPIPEQIESEAAGPLFCAGLTVFSPLARYNTGPGKSVGIVGMGGLGHLAVQFAKALGADKVVVFSHSDRKREDAFKFGATDFVVTGAGPDAFTPWSFQLDLIISTVDVAGGFPLAELIGTLGVNGHLITVGLPDDPLPPFKASGFAKNGASIGGSHIGSKKEAILMLKIAAEKNVRPLVQVLPMSKAGEAVTKVKNGDVHYRYVLKADI